MKKRKIRYDRIIMLLVILIGFIYGGTVLLSSFNNKDNDDVTEKKVMLNFKGKDIEELNSFAKNNNLMLNITYEYDDNTIKNSIISQNVEENTLLSTIKTVDIVVSLGKLDKEKLKEDKIDELGNVPVMMYHGIINKKSAETKYTGGNVDKDGYNRTVEAFREDLEFYYKNNYRMVRLIDYVTGNIDLEYGKSPIVLTFDDGNANNLNVTGLDQDGNIIIDENSAVGVLESFKKKYSDYNVTATFFVNGALFNQKEYNEKILNWLVDNGYDIGNHTMNHVDFKNISSAKAEEEIARVYDKLDEIIKGKYVNIIALPFGSPYNKSHSNFSHILSGSYNNRNYENISLLRVGWEADLSPYNKSFDRTFVKRCRAYDNDGKDFDIEMNFRLLKNKRYISDGQKDIITIPEDKEDLLIETDKKVITY